MDNVRECQGSLGQRVYAGVKLALMLCAIFALLCVGHFALRLAAATTAVQSDVHNALGSVDTLAAAVTVQANSLQPALAALPTTINKLGATADGYTAVATTLNKRLPATLDKLDGAVDQYAAIGKTTNDALNDPQKGIRASLQNFNAIQLQAGIASGEAAQASIAQRKQLEEFSKKVNVILSNLLSMSNDGSKLMHDLANPKKSPMWLRVLGVVLGNGVQGAARGVAAR